MNSVMTIKASAFSSLAVDVISNTNASLCCCLVWHNYRVVNEKRKKKGPQRKEDTAITAPCNYEVNPTSRYAGACQWHYIILSLVQNVRVMPDGMRLFLIKEIVI